MRQRSTGGQSLTSNGFALAPARILLVMPPEIGHVGWGENPTRGKEIRSGWEGQGK